MNISVILCTFDRCRQLAKTLDSILASQLPASIEWEVLVVDNNSTDQTRSVVEEFCGRHPGRVRYLFEPKPGKSYALNAGIREARGEILAFTDDDVTVEPTWLQNLTAPLNDSQWTGVGGRIVSQWPASLPNWLSIKGPYARHGFPDFDFGPEARELTFPPFGTNMAFRKAAFDRYGGFRTDLGPSPNREIPRVGEDTEFGRRLISAGKRLCYEPSAVVFHPVPEDKISQKHILALQFDRGRATAREFRNPPPRMLLGRAVGTLRWITSVKPSERFYRRQVLSEKAGMAAELRVQSREAQEKRLQKAEAVKRDVEAIKQDRANLLHLKAGEWVEVRSQEEILATLDERGCLGNLPFMPEMLNFCGKQFRVYKRADKTCDNIEPWSLRRMTNSVHLEGVRCDGEGHGGCQAACMIFWKEAWLKRAAKDVVSAESLRPAATPQARSGLYTVANLIEASSHKNEQGETIYSCQATDLLRFTSYMPSWDPRQYVRDFRSGNVTPGLANDSRAHRALEGVLGILYVLRAALIGLFNTVQEMRHWRPSYPFLEGAVSAQKTPTETLNLQPGELVQVRSREEIMATLDKQNRNRGMLFDGGSLTFCGGIYRVLSRVHRIVDEKTGRMLDMKTPCIILEGVTCPWDYHRLCPKESYPYWRENWLKRAAEPSQDSSSARSLTTVTLNVREGALQQATSKKGSAEAGGATLQDS